MKKVAIITINGNFNYGNRLQNYALKHTLEKLYCEVTNLWFTTPKEIIKHIIKKFPIVNKRFTRYNNFSNFTNKFLNVKYCSQEYNKDLFDYYVVGSDQVWNYTFPTYSKHMFLPFSSKEKNFSYAGSFGLEKINENKKEEIKKGLDNLNYISVREEKAKEIVKELTGRNDVELVVDPTMLLSDNEWDKISRKPKQLKHEKYILNYFLGNLSTDRKNKIRRFAQDNNCEIIDILNPSDPFYNCGPEEFLYLEKNAYLICTDSFHSSVFAIIYNRPFMVFEREDNEEKMNSRIDTLLKQFHLENRRFNEAINANVLKDEYNESNEILKKEREKALNFLKKSLDIVD